MRDIITYLVCVSFGICLAGLAGRDWWRVAVLLFCLAIVLALGTFLVQLLRRHL